MIKPPPAVEFIGTFGLTLLAIAGLFTVDTFLAKVDRRENDVEAVRYYKEGRELLARGENLKAIDRLSDAIEVERTNRDYQRALAKAQLGAGRTLDADSTLSRLLEMDSADGEASLLMAHVLMNEGKHSEAISFFHRAIYGHWDQDEEGNRRKARSELIDVLSGQNSKQELLAELLAFQADGEQDMQARTRMGDLFLQAGSPNRASDVFRSILHDRPTDVAGYKGIGEAEFAKGNYRSAQREFQIAARMAPQDQGIQRRLEVCNRILELDPTIRGLPADERFGRSVKVLALTVEEVSACADPADPATNGVNAELLNKAKEALAARVAGAQRSEASEADLDLAEQLWQARKKDCKNAPVANSPLAMVLARQTQ